jgi:sn-glycerol 3-phosphate transport system permease protein
MVEHRPWLTYLTHATLILGCLIIAFPIYTTLVASTHRLEDITSYFPLLPGRQLIENYHQALTVGSGEVMTTVWTMLMNSAIMAFGIAFGKIFISLLSAFAIVYFRFRFRMTFFWLIFITLMLPVEVRILPTYEVMSNLRMLNSYSGLIL